MKQLRVLAVLVCTLLSFNLSAFAAPAPVAKKVPIIIDTDMAIDDWMAILYLLKHPNVDVRGIIVNGTGEAHCAPGMDNALKLTHLSKYPNVPVACGRENTYEGGTVFPAQWREQVNALLGLELPASPEAPHEHHGVDVLAKLIRESDEKVHILTLGALTNIADLVTKHPELLPRIERIVAMGGTVFLPGNVKPADNSYNNEVSEWNFYVDPKSVDITIRSGVPFTMVSLDATNTVRLDHEFFKRISKNRKTPEAEFIFQIIEKQSDFVHSQGWYFWDPLAAVYMVRPDIIKTETHKISVILGPDERAGQTVIANDGVPVTVTVDADAEAFYKEFLGVINRK